jgi:hypothetical protein
MVRAGLARVQARFDLPLDDGDGFDFEPVLPEPRTLCDGAHDLEFAVRMPYHVARCGRGTVPTG